MELGRPHPLSAHYRGDSDAAQLLRSVVRRMGVLVIPVRGSPRGLSDLPEFTQVGKNGAWTPSSAFGFRYPGSGVRFRDLEFFLIVGMDQVNKSKFVFQRAERLFCQKVLEAS